MSLEIQLGLDTFGDVTVDSSGTPLSQAEVLRNVVEEGALADRVGVDFLGVGEHHRNDFAVSAPEVVLAAIASRTSRIVLGSSVTVLSSDDPIRVFQRFSTLDALCRALNCQPSDLLEWIPGEFDAPDPAALEEVDS